MCYDQLMTTAWSLLSLQSFNIDNSAETSGRFNWVVDGQNIGYYFDNQLTIWVSSLAETSVFFWLQLFIWKDFLIFSVL